MRNFPVLLYLVLLTAVSCIKEVEFTAPPFTSHLVLSSILNPDSTIKVHVSTTKAITDTATENIGNAIVLLYKESFLLDTLQPNTNGWYYSSFFPEVNSVYRIVAQHPRFAAATSECRIPSMPLVSSFVYNVGEQLDSEGLPITRFTLELDDPSSETNFYELILYSGNPADPSVQPMSTANIIHLNDPTLKSDWNWDFSPSTLFFSDALFNGSRGSITFNVRWGSYPTPESPPYYVAIRNTSSSYYYYLRSWCVHQFNQNSTFNTRDPLTLLFQGEPIELYSNVVNGYGIFGAYNQTLAVAQYIP